MTPLALLKRYLAASTIGHLAWEIAQLPLYTLFHTAAPATIAFDVLHCTVGDLMIALAAFAVAFGIVRAFAPGRERSWVTAVPAIALGVAYTIFSEWLNVEVRGSWAYTPAMPLVPPLGTGLAPLMQWLVVPTLAFFVAFRRTSQRGRA